MKNIIRATIRIGREIWCLPCAGFFLFKDFMNSLKFPIYVPPMHCIALKWRPNLSHTLDYFSSPKKQDYLAPPRPTIICLLCQDQRPLVLKSIGLCQDLKMFAFTRTLDYLHLPRPRKMPSPIPITIYRTTLNTSTQWKQKECGGNYLVTFKKPWENMLLLEKYIWGSTCVICKPKFGLVNTETLSFPNQCCPFTQHPLPKKSRLSGDGSPNLAKLKVPLEWNSFI